MALIRLLALGVALTGCVAAKSNTSTTPPPSEPAYEEPSTSYEEPAYEEPAVLPGSYQEGLGNPYILVANNLDTDLSISVTDSMGYQYAIYAPAYGSYEVVISPGTFSYQASYGAESSSGQYVVEYDNAYEWTWAYQPIEGEGYDDGYDDGYDEGYDDY